MREQEWAVRRDEIARQEKTVRKWLDAHDWEPASTIFKVPGVPGFWVLGLNKVFHRAEVAVSVQDQHGSHYEYVEES